ncbi:MAG: cell division protein FtsL [Candidatus Competibacterales bacterium]|nr:cell division protein FtsL [Candidatus Competibacterales bacterium]
MNRHVLPLGVLALAVLLSGLVLVHSAYRSRSLTSELQELEQARTELDLEWQQLLLEQSALTAKPLIDRTARRELDMTAPEPAEIIYLQR